MVDEQSSSVLRSLVCHRDVDMAISCLGSMLRFAHDPMDIVLHEDGSLTRADIERLEQHLPGVRFVLRAAADELMNERLKNYPHCYQYRYTQPFALKLLDVPLLSEGDVAFCDSDILFMQPFRDLFRWPDADTSVMFMGDCREAYSVRPWDLVGRNRIRLPSRVNVGLYLLRKRAHDLDFIEWCLGRAEFRQVMIWIEQTCWAALGKRVGCRLWDVNQIAVMTPGLNLDDKVAAHFTSRVRNLLPAAIRRLDQPAAYREPVAVRTVAPTDCHPFALARSHARHECGLLRDDLMARFRKPLEKVVVS